MGFRYVPSSSKYTAFVAQSGDSLWGSEALDPPDSGADFSGGAVLEFRYDSDCGEEEYYIDEVTMSDCGQSDDP